MTPKKFSTRYKHLKTKWHKRHQHLHQKLWEKHTDALNWIQEHSKQTVGGSMAALMMLMSPAIATTFSQVVSPEKQVIDEVDKKSQLKAYLSSLLPEEVQPLSADQEKKIGKILSEYFNVPVSAELQGKRLNRSYGLIGAEQHLMRFPGEQVENMAPGRGAYGYFASSQDALSQKDIDREKYYIAVQTFLSPSWKENPNEMYNFFRYRKMLVVNPENGKAVVADIADAGPAEFTGKHLGGSPEVMQYLERQDGAAKGPVIYMFIDDPEDKIPLGPFEVTHEL